MPSIVATSEVWSGSTSLGNFNGATCGDWTDSSGVDDYGDAFSSSGTWLRSTSQNCSNTARLYSISPAIGAPIVLGDMNGDFNVPLLDAPLLVEALVNRPAYDAHLYSVDPDINGDVNQDGTFDTGDIRVRRRSASVKAGP